MNNKFKKFTLMGVTVAAIAGFSASQLHAQKVLSPSESEKIQSAIKKEVSKNLQEENLTHGGFADMKDVIATGGLCAPIANDLSNQYHDKLRAIYQDAQGSVDLARLKNEQLSEQQLGQIAKARVNFYMHNVVETSDSTQVIDKNSVEKNLQIIRQKALKLEECLDRKKPS